MLEATHLYGSIIAITLFSVIVKQVGLYYKFRLNLISKPSPSKIQVSLFLYTNSHGVVIYRRINERQMESHEWLGVEMYNCDSVEIENREEYNVNK